MSYKFNFHPMDHGSILTVHLNIEAYEEDDGTWDIDYLETPEGLDFDINDLSDRDRKALENEVEEFALDNMHEVYYAQRADEAERAYDAWKDGSYE